MTDPADAKTDPLFLIDPREQKQPVWVQDLINTARRRVRDAEQLAEQARLDTAPGDSPIVLDDRGPHGESRTIGLGRRPWVKLVLERYPDGDPKRYIEFAAEFDRDSAIPVAAQVRGSDGLLVAPWAHNAVRVYLTER